MLREGVEVISGLAYPLPVMVITKILGVPPEDRERFRGCARSWLAP
jgi:cytochrome P450